MSEGRGGRFCCLDVRRVRALVVFPTTELDLGILRHHIDQQTAIRQVIAFYLFMKEFDAGTIEVYLKRLSFINLYKMRMSRKI